VDLNQLVDGELIKRVRRGDLEGLGVLYERHRLQVFRVALAITRDREAAEDVLQEVFLRVNRYAARIDTDLPLMPWLYRVTVNLSCTAVRRPGRWQVSLEDFIDRLIAPVQNSPEPCAEVSEVRRAVQDAIDRLPEPHRVVVVLYYLAECNLKEIADILSCPVGTVKSRLHYARENLRAALEGSPVLFPELLVYEPV
jgi:RNA polymerase sigma-70 factor (ECF subfamily)